MLLCGQNTDRIRVRTSIPGAVSYNDVVVAGVRAAENQCKQQCIAAQHQLYSALGFDTYVYSVIRAVDYNNIRLTVY